MGLKVETNSSNQATGEEEQLPYFQLTQWKSYYLDLLEVHDGAAAVIAGFASDFSCLMVEGPLADSYLRVKNWLEVLTSYYWNQLVAYYSTKG